MTTFKKYLRYAQVAVFIIAVLSVILNVRQRREVRRVTDNLHVKTEQYESLQGLTVTQSQAYQSTIKELRYAAKTDAKIRSDYENKLAEAMVVIKELQKKVKNVESVNTITIESNKVDTVFIKVENEKIVIDPIIGKHWNIDFEVINNKLMVADMTYSALVNVVVDREKGKAPTGKKRFILCRVLKPKWVYNSSAVCNDPDAEITTNVYIRFDKNKKP